MSWFLTKAFNTLIVNLIQIIGFNYKMLNASQKFSVLKLVYIYSDKYNALL